jgi:hypothetical protein
VEIFSGLWRDEIAERRVRRRKALFIALFAHQFPAQRLLNIFPIARRVRQSPNYINPLILFLPAALAQTSDFIETE